MDDSIDRTLEALRVQIKKEIVDNYFSERVYLEEEVQLLNEEVLAYREEAAQVARLFGVLYQALGTESAIAGVMVALGLKERPYYEEFRQLAPGARRELPAGVGRWGFTAAGRFRNLIFDLYEKLEKQSRELQEKYQKIQIHLRLLNEDIDKFNLSFDFGLIAAQIEALEGRGQVISGGLLAPEREELSTRMRFKHRKLTEADLPPPPALPRLKEVKGRLAAVLDKT